ncbi:hypothetical protein MACH09_41140 [Vibrio sp. MACH09]|uniref:RNase A-like domain-containing protein n=1 Tax=Vibrio sp. MACH09 TaxID=3025122 RepID=UPI002791B9CE|nr:RNase A-like domain-containing protein [Vibrio sp. MACH09]GLO63606.1 hypothetical protein MACH09_41140 [Vibrio sp. MACH09]
MQLDKQGVSPEITKFLVNNKAKINNFMIGPDAEQREAYKRATANVLSFGIADMVLEPSTSERVNAIKDNWDTAYTAAGVPSAAAGVVGISQLGPDIAQVLLTKGVVLKSKDELVAALKSWKVDVTEATKAGLDSLYNEYNKAVKVFKPKSSSTNTSIAGNKALTSNTKLDVADTVPEIKTESGGTLIFHENLDGHTIRRHVGRTDDELLARLQSEPDILGSSTYSDLNTAQKVVGNVLSRNSDSIQDWLQNSSKSRLTLNESFDYEIGRVISKGADSSVPTNKAFVLLVKDPLAPKGYRVHTSFPKPNN